MIYHLTYNFDLLAHVTKRRRKKVVPITEQKTRYIGSEKLCSSWRLFDLKIRKEGRNITVNGKEKLHGQREWRWDITPTHKSIYSDNLIFHWWNSGPFENSICPSEFHRNLLFNSHIFSEPKNEGLVFCVLRKSLFHGWFTVFVAFPIKKRDYDGKMMKKPLLQNNSQQSILP